jgi:hypothetical protein
MIQYKQRLSNTIEPYYTPPNNNQCLWDNLPDELIVRVFYCLSVSDVPYFGVVSNGCNIPRISLY